MSKEAEGIVNYQALSKAVTGSSRKIRQSNTADKYADDVQELIDLIDTWLKWKKVKHR